MNKSTISKSWFEKKYKSNDGSVGYLRLRNEALTRVHHNTAIESIIKYSGGKKFNTFVDIGSACGDFTDLIYQNLDIEIGIGLDFIRDGLVIGDQRYTRPFFAEAKLPDLPIKNDIADLVLAMEVLYYLSEVELNQAIKNICRVTNVEGYVVVSVTLGNGSRQLNEEKILDLFKEKFRLKGKVYEHSLLQQIFHKNIGRILRYTKKFNIVSLRNTCFWLRDNIKIAKFNYVVAKYLLGTIAIKKGLYIFEKKSNVIG